MAYSNRSRIKSKARIRSISRIPVLTVFKSHKHIRAVLTFQGKVLTSASTSALVQSKKLTYGGNKEASTALGEYVAQKIKSLKHNQIAFNRNGWPFHGRIKSLVESIKESGITV
ncbi:MAG: 50S ribosomal protein L18 [Pseudomonadota bacterium]|nr:50S ribosomal protein L18 [Pseudomonadota bacterium]